MNKDEKGFYVSTDLYDEKGTLLAKIQDNNMDAVGGTVCCLERPDLSTLVVKNRKGKELLYVHLTNQHVIEVRGFFAYPGQIPVEVTSYKVKYGTDSLDGDCLGTVIDRVSDSDLIFR